MNRLFIAAALLSVATAASAADMQARPYTKAPPPLVSPAYNWSGFYIGAMGGYGWGTDAGSGGFGGGTVGYNWQLPGSQFVFGVEVDAAGASIKDSFSQEVDIGVLTQLKQDSKINAFGSVTGRAGFAMDAVLLYAKGGFAWGNNKTTLSLPEFGISNSDSHTHTGYTLGGGIEWDTDRAAFIGRGRDLRSPAALDGRSLSATMPRRPGTAPAPSAEASATSPCWWPPCWSRRC